MHSSNTHTQACMKVVVFAQQLTMVSCVMEYIHCVMKSIYCVMKMVYCVMNSYTVS